MPARDVILTISADVAGVKTGIDGVNTHLASLNRSIEEMNRRFSESAKQAQSSFASISSSISSVSTNILGVGTAIAGLVGVFSIFEKIKSGLESIASSGIKYNSQMEMAKLGIEGQITAMVDFTDKSGKVIAGLQKQTAITGTAVRVMNDLEEANKKTTATLTQLVEGFQVIAPLIYSFGGNTKDAVKYTTLLTQTMGALGIPLEQIGMEGRQALEGTVHLSRVLQGIGVTVEDVAKHRALGNYFEWMTSKMQPFAEMGDKTAHTFTGALSNMMDALNKYAGSVTGGLFESIKNSMEKFIDMISNPERYGEAFVKLKDDFTNFYNFIGKKIEEFVTNLPNKMKGIEAIVHGAFEVIIGSVQLLMATLDKLLTKLGEIASSMENIGHLKKVWSGEEASAFGGTSPWSGLSSLGKFAFGAFSPSFSIPLTGGGGRVNREELQKTLQEKLGLGEAGAAGIIGNLGYESGLVPTALGPETKSGRPFGLAQWLGPRKKQLEDYAKFLGKSVDDPTAQIQFLIWELTSGGYQDVLAKLKTAKTPEEATSIFLKGFEKPSEAEIKASEGERTRLAKGGAIGGAKPRTASAEDIEAMNKEGDAARWTAESQKKLGQQYTATGDAADEAHKTIAAGQEKIKAGTDKMNESVKQNTAAQQEQAKALEAQKLDEHSKKIEEFTKAQEALKQGILSTVKLTPQVQELLKYTVPEAGKLGEPVSMEDRLKNIIKQYQEMGDVVGVVNAKTALGLVQLETLLKQQQDTLIATQKVLDIQRKTPASPVEIETANKQIKDYQDQIAKTKDSLASLKEQKAAPEDIKKMEDQVAELTKKLEAATEAKKDLMLQGASDEAIKKNEEQVASLQKNISAIQTQMQATTTLGGMQAIKAGDVLGRVPLLQSYEKEVEALTDRKAAVEANIQVDDLQTKLQETISAGNLTEVHNIYQQIKAIEDREIARKHETEALQEYQRSVQQYYEKFGKMPGTEEMQAFAKTAMETQQDLANREIAINDEKWSAVEKRTMEANDEIKKMNKETANVMRSSLSEALQDVMEGKKPQDALQHLMSGLNKSFADFMAKQLEGAVTGGLGFEGLLNKVTGKETTTTGKGASLQDFNTTNTATITTLKDQSLQVFESWRTQSLQIFQQMQTAQSTASLNQTASTSLSVPAFQLTSTGALPEDASKYMISTPEGKAGGGFAGPDKPFLVGEAGPELFIPQLAGYIIPHDTLLQLKPESQTSETSSISPWLQLGTSALGATNLLLGSKSPFSVGFWTGSKKSAGGPVQPWHKYPVGEQGSEMYIPSGSSPSEYELSQIAGQAKDIQKVWQEESQQSQQPGWMSYASTGIQLLGLLGSGLFKAGGGDVRSGYPFIVGEQGPELFVPDSAGSILPHNRLQDLNLYRPESGSGSSSTSSQPNNIVINMNLHSQGQITPQDRRSWNQMTLEASKHLTRSMKRNGV